MTPLPAGAAGMMYSNLLLIPLKEAMAATIFFMFDAQFMRHHNSSYCVFNIVHATHMQLQSGYHAVFYHYIK